MIGTPNKFGYQLQQFYHSQFHSLDEFILSGSFIVARMEGKTLLCHNHKRNQWELPAGKRESDETPQQCAARELKEETSQTVEDLSWVGVMKLVDIESGLAKYNPIYIGELGPIQAFQENDETDSIVLWDGIASIGEMDEVDVALIHYLDRCGIK